MRSTITAIIVLLLGMASAHAEQTIYKWRDNGQVHYGAQPPQGVDAVAVDVRTGSPNPSERGSARANEKSRASGAGAGKMPGERGKARGEDVGKPTPDPEFLKRQCAIARKNVDTLSSGSSGSRRFRNEEGEVMRYTPEQIEQSIAENRAFIEKNCQGQPGGQ